MVNYLSVSSHSSIISHALREVVLLLKSREHMVAQVCEMSCVGIGWRINVDFCGKTSLLQAYFVSETLCHISNILVHDVDDFNNSVGNLLVVYWLYQTKLT